MAAPAKTAKKPTGTPGSQAAIVPASAYPHRSTAIRLEAKNTDDCWAVTARALTRPEVGAASIIEKLQPDTHDINALIGQLRSQVDAVNGGDMGQAEGMLIAQAHTLQELFNNFTRRALSCANLDHLESYMRMAMKAQNQCRMAIESLAEMKNPRPVAFVKNANIAQNQQINNGVAQERQIPKTEVLEQPSGKRMDPRAKETTVETHSHLAAVGTVHRPTNARRQS